MCQGEIIILATGNGGFGEETSLDVGKSLDGAAEALMIFVRGKPLHDK